MDIVDLRKNIGMVFQKGNPFPQSIFDNVAYGPRVHGTKNKKKLQDIVEKSLKDVALWDEVKDRLHTSAFRYQAASSSVFVSPERLRQILIFC